MASVRPIRRLVVSTWATVSRVQADAPQQHLVGQALLGQVGLGPQCGDVAPHDVLDAGAPSPFMAHTLPAAGQSTRAAV